MLQQTWLAYFSALVLITSAFNVVRRHPSTSGYLLGAYLMSTGLYLIASVPVTSRSVTLPPECFRGFVKLIYASAAGTISILHFAFLFPRKKTLIEKARWLPLLWYGVAATNTLLYCSGRMGFGATLPAFAVVVVLIICLLIHSIRTEDDPFYRQQINFVLRAPIIVIVLLLVSYLVAGAIDTPWMSLVDFAILCLVLPFSLIAAMDNLAEYETRLGAERQTFQARLQRQSAQTEAAEERARRIDADHRATKERLETRWEIRADLHDAILGDLAMISRDAEFAIKKLTLISAGQISIPLHEVRKILESTSRRAAILQMTSRQFLDLLKGEFTEMKDFVMLIESVFIAMLRESGIEARRNLGSLERDQGPAPPDSVRIVIFMVVREAVTNIRKHSGAKEASLSLFVDREQRFLCKIGDDGSGFVQPNRSDGSGLRNMKTRVENLRGDFDCQSKPGFGTVIQCTIPLRR